MNKHIIAILAAAVMTAVTALSAGAFTLGIDPAESFVTPGESFEVSVIVEGIDSLVDLSSVSFDLLYDPAVIDFAGVSFVTEEFGSPVTEDFADFFASSSYTVVDGFGSLTFAIGNIELLPDFSLQPDTFTVATFDFIAGSDLGMSPLAIDMPMVTDGAFMPIPEFGIVDAKVTVAPVVAPVLLMISGIAGLALLRKRA